MEKISWTDRVRNGEMLQRVLEYRNILRAIKWMNANWIGHILRNNNNNNNAYLLQLGCHQVAVFILHVYEI